MLDTGTSLASFMRSARRWPAALVWLVALPCAALEPAYLSEFPDPKRVIADFQGTDRLDTLALQMAALNRLNRFVREMAGARYNTAGQYPTADEQRVQNALRAAATPLGAAVDAALGTGPRLPGTPLGEWHAKFDEYQYGDELYQRLMDSYFSPSFRAAHAASTAAVAASQERGREQLERGRRALAGESEPAIKADRTREIQFGLAMLALVVLGGAHLLRRAKISANAPYRFRLGFKRYRIEWISGVLANYSSHVFEQSGVDRIEGERYYVTKKRASTFYTKESFTIDDSAGRSEAIQVYDRHPTLKGQVGQRVTAAWITYQGRRHYLGFWSALWGREVPHGATEESLVPFFRPWRWTVCPAIALGYVVGDLAAPFEFAGLVFAFGAYFVWLAVFMFVTWQRRTAFRRDEVIPLLARLTALPG
jgi:hypothetical protein